MAAILILILILIVIFFLILILIVILIFFVLGALNPERCVQHPSLLLGRGHCPPIRREFLAIRL